VLFPSSTPFPSGPAGKAQVSLCVSANGVVPEISLFLSRSPFPPLPIALVNSPPKSFYPLFVQVFLSSVTPGREGPFPRFRCCFFLKVFFSPFVHLRSLPSKGISPLFRLRFLPSQEGEHQHCHHSTCAKKAYQNSPLFFPL